VAQGPPGTAAQAGQSLYGASSGTYADAHLGYGGAAAANPVAVGYGQQPAVQGPLLLQGLGGPARRGGAKGE
jgi:hypothetical protein